MRILITGLVLSTVSLFGLDLSHLNDYFFFNGKNHFEGEAFYSAVGGADLQDPPEPSKLYYSEAGASAYAGFYPNKDNTISFQGGYNLMRINWNENPVFSQKNFNDLVVSLAWISTSLPDWRWVMDVGAHIDTNYYNLATNTFYTAFLWGRLSYKPYMGFNYGFLGQVGVKSYYILPIIGLDTFVSQHIQICAVFPLDISVAYYVSRQLHFRVKWRSFGGWYRANHEAKIEGPGHGPLITLSSSGVDGGVYFDGYGLRFSAFGGWDFGGWLFTQNYNKTNKEYYHFGGAPYAGGKLDFAF